MESKIFNSLFIDLRDKDIEVVPETLKKHTHQGLMSSVWTIDSNVGPLVIHLLKLVAEHVRNKVWEKFSGLATIFASHLEIPTARIRHVGHVEGAFVLVQDFLSGPMVGKRRLRDGVISNDWGTDQMTVVKDTLIILARVHKTTLEGFGWPALQSNTLRGPYPTWKSFLETEAPRWIRTVVDTDKRILQDSSIGDILGPYTERTLSKIAYAGPASLVHGDAGNPSNLLTTENGVALLDWEWSIAADPAWEFCDLGWWPFLDRTTFVPYFDTAGIRGIPEQEAFLERARLYRFLWLLWGTHLHPVGLDLKVYVALRELLIASTKERN